MHPTVAVAEEEDLRHADRIRRVGLLLPAKCRNVVASHAGVEAAGIAIGDDAVAHLHPGFGHLRDGSGGTEVDVIGMSSHDKCTLDLRKREHDYEPTPEGRYRYAPEMATDVALGTFDLSDPEFWLARDLTLGVPELAQ